MRRVIAYMGALFAALPLCLPLSGAGGSNNEFDPVLKLFPGYRLMTLKERDSETRAFFRRHFPKDNPSLVRADLNGDGHPDYAALVRDPKSGATKLVVLLCSAKHQCKSVYQLDETAYAGSVYLRPVSRGSRVSQAEAADGSGQAQAIKLESTGIQVTYFEKGKVVLYWSRKHRKIEEVGTED